MDGWQRIVVPVNEIPLSTAKQIEHMEPAVLLPQVTFWGAVQAVVWKDITLEWRTRQLLSIMVMFAIAVVVVFNFALETNLDAVRNVAAGSLPEAASAMKIFTDINQAEAWLARPLDQI